MSSVWPTGWQLYKVHLKCTFWSFLQWAMIKTSRFWCCFCSSMPQTLNWCSVSMGLRLQTLNLQFFRSGILYFVSSSSFINNVWNELINARSVKSRKSSYVSLVWIWQPSVWSVNRDDLTNPERRAFKSLKTGSEKDSSSLNTRRRHDW